jgi:hypothetical protein
MKCFGRILWIAAFVAIACSVGCSGEAVETVPVYGKVSFSAREAPKICRLFFQPVQTASVTRPSSATTEADGTYEAKAFRDSDGLVPGTYKVQVSYYDLRPGANPNLETSYVESVYDAGELVVADDADEVEHNIEVPAKTVNARR